MTAVSIIIIIRPYYDNDDVGARHAFLFNVQRRNARYQNIRHVM